MRYSLLYILALCFFVSTLSCSNDNEYLKKIERFESNYQGSYYNVGFKSISFNEVGEYTAMDSIIYILHYFWHLQRDFDESDFAGYSTRMSNMVKYDESDIERLKDDSKESYTQSKLYEDSLNMSLNDIDKYTYYKELRDFYRAFGRAYLEASFPIKANLPRANELVAQYNELIKDPYRVLGTTYRCVFTKIDVEKMLNKEFIKQYVFSDNGKFLGSTSKEDAEKSWLEVRVESNKALFRERP